MNLILIPVWGSILIFSLLSLPVRSDDKPSIQGLLSEVPSEIGPLNSQTQPQLKPTDQELLDRLIAEAKIGQINAKPFSDRLEFFALKLLGQPYQAGLLDQSSTEELFLSLTQFDCVLFVEAVLALAHTSTLTHERPPDSSTIFAQRVQNLRYRNGVRNGYCSRLHYFSEWLDNNQTHGYLKNLSAELKGVPLNKQLQFMSRHRNSYAPLANSETYDCIVQMEDRLASLPMHYIPTASIDQIEDQLQAGDIIAIATAVPYLDVTHTGLIYQEQNGRKGLIHASPGGSVRLAKNLSGYVRNVDSAIGIMVARPIEPVGKSLGLTN
jgi:hypothetical protein